jgi:hypothetical protein
MNPEKAAMHTIDSRKRIDNIKDTAEKLLPLHTHLEQVMEMIAIHPENFGACYDAETISSD